MPALIDHGGSLERTSYGFCVGLCISISSPLPFFSISVCILPLSTASQQRPSSPSLPFPLQTHNVRMQLSTFVSFSAALTTVSAVCEPSTRLAAARQVIYAYNLDDPGASATAFKDVPWGAPNAGGACLTTIIPDGSCPIPVALTGAGTYDFAISSRQVFSNLTGEFIDFPANGTVLINTEVVSCSSSLLKEPELVVAS